MACGSDGWGRRLGDQWAKWTGTLHKGDENIWVGMGKLIEVLGCWTSQAVWQSYLPFLITKIFVFSGFSYAVRGLSSLFYQPDWPKFQFCQKEHAKDLIQSW